LRLNQADGLEDSVKAVNSLVRRYANTLNKVIDLGITQTRDNEGRMILQRTSEDAGEEISEG